MQRLDIGFQCDDAQIYIVKSMEAIKKLKIKKKNYFAEGKLFLSNYRKCFVYMLM